jgi:predicted phage terminase large subunit-like protein
MLAAQMTATLSPAGLAAYATRGGWKPAPHLDLLNRCLLDVAAGRVSRLLVTMPPRHGKSELCSVFLPAWWLGNRPDDRVILASYEADFAASWGRRVRDVLDEYGPTLFGVSLRADSQAAHRWDIDGHRGGMICAGVGGAITGRGAHLLIVDDPVKSPEDAQSDALSSGVWDWWRGVARTRLEPGAAVVLVMTRWSETDLAGRLVADQEGEPWTVLNLPALAEEDDPLNRQPGEPLWPERFGVEDLEATRRALGTYLWAALYQGHPAPLDGNIFRRSWFRYWTPAGENAYLLHQPEGKPRTADARRCQVFATVDLAISQKTSADYTVAAMWAATPQHDLLLLERYRGRLDGPSQIELLKKLHREWAPDWIGIEAVAYQMTLVQTLRRAGLPVKELKADRDKISRALTAAARLEGGNVYWPKVAAWLGEWETELLAFPNGRHDDQADVFAYAALQASRHTAIDPDALAQGLDKFDLTQIPGWKM